MFFLENLCNSYALMLRKVVFLFLEFVPSSSFAFVLCLIVYFLGRILVLIKQMCCTDGLIFQLDIFLSLMFVLGNCICKWEGVILFNFFLVMMQFASIIFQAKRHIFSQKDPILEVAGHRPTTNQVPQAPEVPF